MIKKTLELTGPVDVRITTVGDNGEYLPSTAPLCMYVSDVDKPGLWFTMDEVKAMHKFFGDIIYSEDGAW